MNLVVLSRSRRVSSTRRLVEAGEARGHKVRVLNALKLQLHLDGRRVRLLYHQRNVATPDVVIPRIAVSIAAYGLPLLDTFAANNVPMLNSPKAIGLSRNPTRVLQLMVNNGLSVPRTVMARDAGELREMVDLVGGVPVLVKLLHGHERRGVMLCESKQSLEAALEAVLGLGHDIIMQEYVRPKGLDLRVVVVGGKVVASVSRVPRPGQLSRTLSRNARLEKVKLTAAQREVAERAAALCELEVCAVDLLAVKKGPPRVFEVNASPSLPETENASGVDLAGAIIRRAEQIARGHRPMASGQ